MALALRSDARPLHHASRGPPPRAGEDLEAIMVSCALSPEVVAARNNAPFSLTGEGIGLRRLRRLVLTATDCRVAALLAMPSLWLGEIRKASSRRYRTQLQNVQQTILRSQLKPTSRATICSL